ncbi:hypothetical protein AUC43_12145 [Hymenobacter sedentarius]|uniref:VWFA domain-containing protein n=1 Tax=Hymenobacter sedentarius TaxID=1411621 RepID=A0A0U4CQV0_9BACT|nr:DUF58 domain-containing protein [Hymenobacter sedentarius]ALW85774.1 hypothetical protein AUC43_12145 [Hymenobacter sedentarius]
MNPSVPPALTALVRRLRHLEIRIRKAVEAQLQGDFHSVFKGTGLEVDDVRLYQYGDEVRAIDWAVSSKGHGTFVKTYKEEKEQQVLVLLDVSASLEVGDGQRRKLDVARDIAGLLALSAARQGSALGLFAFSDQKELYLPPGKGPRAAYALIQRLFALQPQSRRTGVGAGIRQALGLLKRRSLVVLISDFIDGNYERELAMLAQRHDLIVVQTLAPRERDFPALGIVPLRDTETGQVRWVNTSSDDFRAHVQSNADYQEAQLVNICRRNRTGFVSLSTEGDFVPQLVNLFRHRRQSGRRG